jgi:hypothetical protein
MTDGQALSSVHLKRAVDEPAVLRIGAHVLATDGNCGELVRVIIDPVGRQLTHLVVAPPHHFGLGRLVAVRLIETDGDPIHLRCSSADFAGFEMAEEMQFLPASADDWGYGAGQALIWPYFGTGYGAGAMVGPARPFLTDHVPAGEMQVRRGDHVHARDGRIGSVQGLVIDSESSQVTHVLLQQGHLWGRRQLAIPIDATSRVDDEIHIALTKQEVEDLPPVDLHSDHTPAVGLTALTASTHLRRAHGSRNGGR